MQFQCHSCGELHDEVPDLGFAYPDLFLTVPEPEREARTSWDADCCQVDGHFFIRCVLLLPIEGASDTFGFGLWLSLSEQNFRHFKELTALDVPSDDERFVGWISNALPGYPEADLIARARIQGEGQRPLLELKPCEHPLYEESVGGISIERVGELLSGALHPEQT